MQIADAAPFIAQHRKGVLTTVKRDGRPQLSNVVYAWSDGTIRLSVTADRAKTRNLRRDPRASLHVTSDDFWRYVVIEADAELGEVARTPDDEAVAALRELYESISGPHPDWDEYNQAMVDERRLVVTLRPTYVYGTAG